MASGTADRHVVPPPLPGSGPHGAPVRAHERTIRRQLGRTGFHVKLVDLASSLLLLGVGVLGFFLLAAIVDHWLVPLGTAGRVLALLALVVAAGAFIVLRIVPLLVRGINPTYAARTIEESTPSLKNSLINFLLLRDDHQGIREVVYDAI